MKKLTNLHKELIMESQLSFNSSDLPVNPSNPVVPILAMDRWITTGSSLTKRYSFKCRTNRPHFVMALLEYESKTQHHAVLIIDEDAVIIKLVTKNIGKVTEIDKEYARFADTVFKDLVLTPR